MATRIKWTMEQDKFIVMNNGVLTAAQIASALGRSLHSVNHRRKTLGLKYSTEERSKLYSRHGHSSHSNVSPEYKSWNSMMNRCRCKNIPGFENYGGRGITVCDRWHNFENFLADMGKRPSRDYSIERIDNDGPYSPENCKWATDKEQMNNRRFCRFLVHRGRKLTVAQWADELGVPAHRIYHRLDRGWSVTDALTRPISR